MTSSDAGATSSSIISPTVPSPIPTPSNAPSLTLSPASTTSGNLIHRPFAGGLLRRSRPESRQEIHLVRRRIPTPKSLSQSRESTLNLEYVVSGLEGEVHCT